MPLVSDEKMIGVYKAEAEEIAGGRRFSDGQQGFRTGCGTALRPRDENLPALAHAVR